MDDAEYVPSSQVFVIQYKTKLHNELQNSNSYPVNSLILQILVQTIRKQEI